MFHNAEQFKPGDVVVCIHLPTEAKMLLTFSALNSIGFHDNLVDAMRSALDYSNTVIRQIAGADTMGSTLKLGESYTVKSSDVEGIRFEGNNFYWPSSWFESVQDHQEKAKAFLQKQGYVVTKVATPLPSLAEE